MTEAAKEIEYTNIEEGDKVPKHIEELVKKDSERATDTTAADEEKQILADFDKKEKERIAKIEHINELKKQEEYTNSRGLNAQLIQQNKELEKQKEKIDDYEAGKITALDLETDKVTIEAEKIEIEEEVKKSIKFDRSKMRKGAKKFLKDKEETTPSVTKVDGSPTIMSTKNISQLQTSSVFPVDHSLMASLNGYTKTG
jgi:predicted phage tail protein